MIFHAFVITLTVNAIGDLILIPIFKNEGAAFAYLAGYIAQTAFYIYKSDIPGLNKALYPCIICTTCACVGFWGAGFLFRNIWIEIVGSVLIYVALILVTRQFKLSDKINT